MKKYIKYYPLILMGTVLVLFLSWNAGTDADISSPIPASEKSIPSEITSNTSILGADPGASFEDGSSAAFDELVFSDEFDTDGSPDSLKWGYDLGTGSNGWGNGEKQYYTNRLENVKVEGGLLKITARKENYEGSAYTSARLLSEGKFDFTYGRVEVRAKLPFGKGTWPAIWMLGSNFRTVGWPTCGEIDIMEHWGHKQGTVQSALHTRSSFGDTVNHGAQNLDDVSTAFHLYAVEWTADELIFSVDGVVHFTYNPETKNSETWPYDADQFLILNVAMGGSWFTIDPDFVSSTMEIDYVRIYQ